MNDIMIDLETLGTHADAAILSIGAVKFDRHSNEIGEHPFYASISIDSNTEFGRRISEDTLIWWLGQSKAAQEVFHEPKIVLPEALDLLTEWIGRDDYQVWSNGADFDLPMLAHAYHACELSAPWKFFNTNCYRTMKKLPIAKHVAKPQLAIKHNALQDAIFQARHLQGIFHEMTLNLGATA